MPEIQKHCQYRANKFSQKLSQVLSTSKLFHLSQAQKLVLVFFLLG